MPATNCVFARYLLGNQRSVVNTSASQRRIVIMDWMFYFYVFVILLSIIAVLLTIRHMLIKRHEKLEKKQQIEEDAQQIAKSNSGL